MSVKIGGAVVPSVTVVGLGVVVSVGLAALTVTCSLAASLSLTVLLLRVAAVGGVPLVGAGHRPVVGSVKPVGVVYVPLPLTATVSVSTGVLPPLWNSVKVIVPLG